MKLLNLKEEIKEILEELENMYEISELEEQVNNINKIRDYIINLQQKNKQLKEQLLATQTNEETFRLEMEDITKILGLDEYTIFDDVKAYAKSLKDNMFEKEQLNSLVNSCQEEIRRLKKQLEYLRSGEYYNQLRFERDMLQNVVDNGEVSKEDKEFIDMTHRNTELLEQNQELKKQLEEIDKFKFSYRKDETKIPPIIRKQKDVEIIKNLKNQQKEFIEYMNKTIEELECDDVDDEEMKGYLIQRIDTFKEILSKFKKIIGSDINVGSIGDKDE